AQLGGVGAQVHDLHVLLAVVVAGRVGHRLVDHQREGRGRAFEAAAVGPPSGALRARRAGGLRVGDPACCGISVDGAGPAPAPRQGAEVDGVHLPPRRRPQAHAAADPGRHRHRR
ncbi:MAG: hypothetical protein ACK559_21460, partial [bacterium]